MSEFHVRVVRIGEIEKHPNADSLSITQIDGGYPVVFRTGEFNQGDLAAYVPIDSVVPDTEQWSFLGGHRRIKAKKLRGIFSMGMLAPLPADNLTEGDNVQELMSIVKYEAPMKSLITYSDNVPDPGYFPKYTDIEGLRRYKDVLTLGEDVVFSEKIHGANGRWGWAGGQFHVGSHNYWKKRPESDQIDIWWRAAIENDLEQKLAARPDLCFFGEVYGRVQDLNYGVDSGVTVRFFDIFDRLTNSYVPYLEFRMICEELDLEVAPPLYLGGWQGFDAHQSLAEGNTIINGASHVREGFVVRPLSERFDRRCGRVIFKLIGQGYMLRKDA